MLPSYCIAHASFLRLLFAPELARLRAFVDAHPAKPDDLALAALATAATRQLALLPPPVAARGEPRRRRRLLAGGPTWIDARSFALAWICRFFGGFVKVSERVGERMGGRVGGRMGERMGA